MCLNYSFLAQQDIKSGSNPSWIFCLTDKLWFEQTWLTFDARTNCGLFLTGTRNFNSYLRVFGFLMQPVMPFVPVCSSVRLALVDPIPVLVHTDLYTLLMLSFVHISLWVFFYGSLSSPSCPMEGMGRKDIKKGQDHLC